MTSLALWLVLAAGPAVHTLTSSATGCTLFSRTGPEWKPVALATWNEPCVAQSARWSGDGRRVLLSSAEGPAVLLEVEGARRLVLPALPRPVPRVHQRLEFGNDGEVYVFAEVDQDSGADAWAYKLDAGGWKLVEKARAEVTGLVGASAALKTFDRMLHLDQALRAPRKGSEAELKRLEGVPLPKGFSWEVGQAGKQLIAFQVTGTDACVTHAPLVLLDARQTWRVPWEGAASDRCSNVAVGTSVLLVDNATSGADARAQIVDLSARKTFPLSAVDRFARLVAP